MTPDPKWAAPGGNFGSPTTARAGVTEENIEDLYENAPCGYILADPDRRIVAVNATLVTWLGYERSALIDKPFTGLFTSGGRIHYETHFAPLLRLQGQLNGIAVDLVTAGGTRFPVFIAANVKTDTAGCPVLLRIAVHDARDRRSYERELRDARERAQLERRRAEQLARTLQRSLLPPSLFPPAGLNASALYHAAAADDVGGDFYDLFPLSQEKWGLFIGDVCGKGASAAAVTSLTRYTLRAAAVFDDDPVAVLHNLHTVLDQEFRGNENRFCTVIFGVITRGDDGFDVHLASGGHPPALMLGVDGRAEYVETPGGQPVGVLADPTFAATRVRLGAGDVLVLYTDGLTEARTPNGVGRYDERGALLEFAAAHAPTTASEIIDAIQLLLDGFGAGVQDDVAVLALGTPRG